MRLTKEQTEKIHESLLLFLPTEHFQVFLYGSRTHDDLKGGDIDLLVLTTTKGVAIFEKMHLDILVHLKKQSCIGDRRIDLKAATNEELKTEPFLMLIAKDLIEI